MEDLMFAVFAVILVIFQLLTCIFAKKAWLRWFPFAISACLAAFCFAMYYLSDFTNWGYIILVGILGAVLLLQGIILMVTRVMRCIYKG